MPSDSKMIWMDGELIPWEKAQIHVMTHTLHYGLSFFEGIRLYKTRNGPAVFRLKEHIDRFYNSGHIAKVKIPFSKEQLTEGIKATVRANDFEECYIRPLCHLGVGNRGLNNIGAPVHVSIIVWPWGPYLGEDGLKNGIRTKISSYTRHHVNVSLTKAKIAGNYVNSQLAKREVVEMGFEEAILLDPQGYVAEGTGENIFIVRNGSLKTPPLGAVLEGVTRDSVMVLARDQGVPLVEEVFTRDELYIADEAFFTGTAAEVTPIREVDLRQIGEGKPGPVTRKLQDAYFRAVRGEDDQYETWLSPI
ncbi:MAG: branched-chain amino acid transaminase [Planctomycetota bacterium]|nr:branched-chain amino acid transaminase [Planctomycetota bacterium]